MRKFLLATTCACALSACATPGPFQQSASNVVANATTVAKTGVDLLALVGTTLAQALRPIDAVISYAGRL